MTKLDVRVKLLGRALKTQSIAGKTNEQIAHMQQQRMNHNVAVDLLLGAVAPGVELTDTTAGTTSGNRSQPIPIRVYHPTNPSNGPRPLVVNIHGGGWVVGSLTQSDWLCSNVAAAAGAVVVSIYYRLAPTHPWPAAAEDCYAAFLDIVERAAEWGADAQRVAIMGDSAGGNLAAVLTLMARDRSGPKIEFQALIYPATDLTLSSASIEENADAPILTKRDILAYRDHYLQDQDPSDPYASPLLAPDHTGLPPALIQVAEHDPIRDDGLRYAHALRAAGVAVRTTTYTGMPHGFLAFPTICRSAPQALSEVSVELQAALAALSVDTKS